MANCRVGVLRGGRGHEYEVSLQTGASVLEHLPAEKYEGHDILITKDGTWHWAGLPTTPERAGKQVDVFFNALHGEYGEDGQLQSQLDQLALPYTGSGTFASALGMNKVLANKIFRQRGLRVPHGVLLERQRQTAEEIVDLAQDAFHRVPPDWVIKPARGGSSVGLGWASDFPSLLNAIEHCFQYTNQVLVEQYIKGREATVGVVDQLRGQRYYALPPIEIRRPLGSNVWSYQAKYDGTTEEICPGQFSQEIKEQLMNLALQAHQALGLRHYSRADFIVSPYGIYLLEINTLPGMTKESLLPKALQAVGCHYGDFLDHVIQLARQSY